MSGIAEPLADSPTSTEASASARVMRGAFVLLSTQPITWATSLAVAAFVPRYLGDAALGQYGVAWNIAALVSSIASLGLQTVITRKVATAPGRAATYAWSGLLIVTACSLLIAGAILSFVALFGVDGIDLGLTGVATLAALLSTLQGVLLAVVIGLGRNARFALSIAGTQTLTTLAGLGSLFFGGDVYSFAIAGLGGWAAATVVLLWASRLRFTRSALDSTIIRELIAGGIPFLGLAVALRIRGGVDVILTGILLQSNVAGWLVAAHRISYIPVFIPTVITIPLLPALSRSRDKPEEYRSLLANSLATVMLLIVPVSASLLALAPAIPSVLGWPEPLQQSVPVMMILAFQQPLVAIDMVLCVSLYALGMERQWFRVTVAGAILSPLLNVVVIPLTHSLTGNGAIGAAFVDVGIEMLFLACAIYLTPRGLLGRESVDRSVRTVVAGAALVVVANALLPHGFPIAFVGGGLSYVAAAFGLGILGPRQFRAVRIALRAA